MNVSGSYENPVLGIIPSPQYGCSPGSSKLIMATTPLFLNCSIILNSLINLSDGLYEPIIKLSIHSECNPKIAGGCVGHFYQFSCLHQRPMQAIEQ
jgi:hypothetical protein